MVAKKHPHFIDAHHCISLVNWIEFHSKNGHVLYLDVQKELDAHILAFQRYHEY